MSIEYMIDEVIDGSSVEEVVEGKILSLADYRRSQGKGDRSRTATITVHSDHVKFEAHPKSGDLLSGAEPGGQSAVKRVKTTLQRTHGITTFTVNQA